MVRVAIAGIVGGFVVFIGGFVNHMLLDLESRSFKRVASESGLRAALAKETPQPGIYGVPQMSEAYNQMSSEEQKAEWQRVNDDYKKGPSAYIIIAPTGEDMMSPMQLGAEALTNIGAALIAAWLVWMTGTSTRFMARWCMVIMLGLFTWLSTSASFAVWYRFPNNFILDGLLASLIEWTLAGFIIALLVKSKDTQAA